jgi:hypothetical protein
MNNFIKYYGYFVSEYVIEDLYPIFSPKDNMISSGAEMLSYIAELGSCGDVKFKATRNLYEAIGQVVKALFLSDKQFFVTKDRVILRIEGINGETLLKINKMIVSGIKSGELIEKIEKSDMHVNITIIDEDDESLDSVGKECLNDTYPNEEFVGAIPQVKRFTTLVRNNLEVGYEVEGSIQEEFVEESIYSVLELQ